MIDFTELAGLFLYLIQPYETNMGHSLKLCLNNKDEK